jgi:hypothetical protein
VRLRYRGVSEGNGARSEGIVTFTTGGITAVGKLETRSVDTELLDRGLVVVTVMVAADWDFVSVTVTVWAVSRRRNSSCFRNECRSVVWPKSTFIEVTDFLHEVRLVLRQMFRAVAVISTPFKLYAISMFSLNFVGDATYLYTPRSPCSLHPA